MERIEFVDQPPNLRIKLYNHQLASIYKMEQLEQTKELKYEHMSVKTKFGINANPLGYGKTLSMIGLVLRDKMEWPVNEPYRETYQNYVTENEFLIRTLFKTYPRVNTTLVLCSNTTIYQWEKEFKYTPLRVACITTKKLAQSVNIRDYDVVIVSTTMYNHLIIHNQNIAWKRFIYDEPSNIKVPAMKEIVFGFMWLVSATPLEMITHFRSGKSHFMFPFSRQTLHSISLNNGLVIRESDELIRSSYEMPETKVIIYNCYEVVYRCVKGFVNEKVQSLVEAGNIGGAVELLGGKKTDNIIELIKNQKEKELKEADGQIAMWTIREEPEKVTEWQNKKARIETQIKDFNERMTLMLKGTCAICYDHLSKPVMESNCQNLFCGACIFKWLESHNRCPLCRQEIRNKNGSDLVYIDDHKEECKENRPPTKEERILEILSAYSDGKFIVFSDNDESFNGIRKLLYANKISYIELAGTADNRRKLLESFKTDKIRVAFLNSTQDCSGVNMQEATDIIIYHAMREAVEQQIIGRANRIGRSGSLRVHKLVSD